MPAVLVTGATGFLGPFVCKELLSRGFEVRGLARSPEAALEPGVTRFLASDLTDVRALQTAVRGTDAVIHLAGRAHIVDGDEAKAHRLFHSANVDGTRAVLEAATGAGVKRFLLASSIKVMGRYAARAWTEDDIPRPADPYGRSKLAAEVLLQTAVSDGRIEGGIIRLPLVYGAGIKANMLQLFKLVDAGVPLPLKHISNRRSIVYAGNVAAGFLALLETGNSRGDVFFLTDGEAVSSPALINMIADSLGRPARLFSFPESLLRGVGRITDAVGAPLSLPSTSAALSRLTESLECSSARIAAVLGFTPPWSTREGIAITARWYRESRQAIDHI